MRSQSSDDLHSHPPTLMRRAAGFLAAAVLLAACGGGTATSGPTSAANPTGAGTAGAGAEIDVTESDYKIEPSTTTAAPGAVTFHVTNSGTQIHEFVVIKTDLAADQLPTASGSTDVDEEAAGLEVKDEIEDLAPGASQDLTVTLEAGHYVLLCNVPAHYELGMHTDFTVGG